MNSSDSGGGMRDFEAGGDPIEIGISDQQSVKLIEVLPRGIPTRLNQQFRHRDCGCCRGMPRSSEPRKNLIGETHISRIRFHVIDEDAGVQKDPAVLLTSFLSWYAGRV
jgi:hypothetical protein